MRTLVDRRLSGRTLGGAVRYPPGLLIHLDAEDLSPGAVSTWPDRSGNGLDVGQATADRQPVCVANELAGRSVVVFDGINDRLTGPHATPQPLSIVSVVRPSAISTTRIFVGSGTGGGQFQLGHLFSSTWRAFAGSSLSLGSVTTDWYVVGAVFSGSASLIMVNDQSASGNAGSSNGGATLVVGATGGEDSFWAGGMAEMLIWDRPLSFGEMENTYAVLAHKYQL